jgi:hypothetical protein
MDRFSSIAAGGSLSTVRLELNYGSYQCFSLLCSSSERHEVEKLVVELELPLRTLTRSEWEACPDNIIDDPEKKQENWETYKKALEAQNKALDKWKASHPRMWRAIFDRLPNLQSIEFRAGPSSTYHISAANNLDSSSIHYRTLTTAFPIRDTGVEDQDAAYFASETEADKVPGQWMNSILDGLQLSRAPKVVSLAFYDLPTKLFRFLPETVWSMTPGLPELTTLDVRLMAPKSMDAQVLGTVRTNIDTFVNCIGPNLEQLRWIGGCYDPPNSTKFMSPRLFGPRLDYFENLVILELDWTVSTVSELTNSFNAVGGSLENLKLSDITLWGGTWVDMLHRIRKFCPFLEGVSIAEKSDLAEAEGFRLTWRSDFDVPGGLYQRLCAWMKHEGSAPLRATRAGGNFYEWKSARDRSFRF